RRAAEAVAEQQPRRLRALHVAGRLKDLPGVGETIAAIIGEVLDGRVPAYLAELEAAPLPAHSAAADAYRRALQGDCHSHSDWSDGGSDIRTMAEAAIALGHSYLVLTDHSPRLTVAHGLDGPDAGGYREPALRHPWALHRANHRGSRSQTVHLRRGQRIRGMRPHGYGGGDQLPA